MLSLYPPVSAHISDPKLHAAERETVSVRGTEFPKIIFKNRRKSIIFVLNTENFLIRQVNRKKIMLSVLIFIVIIFS
ncbi:MAG: hypothetical protein BWK80_21190 [Desulfobacteraceae bacterium IS3]|nr:MAG: hypothetical protein BWK80_21190 [Desulfobacteraceae bacterium IS3]HAO21175.1 hypothetical protein [Desulfobacteraceae bacterium]